MKGKCELAPDINTCLHYKAENAFCLATNKSCCFFYEDGGTRAKTEYQRQPRWFEQYYKR